MRDMCLPCPPQKIGDSNDFKVYSFLDDAMFVQDIADYISLLQDTAYRITTEANVYVQKLILILFLLLNNIEVQVLKDSNINT